MGAKINPRNPEWYGVKSLVRWFSRKGKKTLCVEERVVIFKARSFDDAIAQAERELKAYCKRDKDATFNLEPAGFINAYWIGDPRLVPGIEVFSRFSKTTLSARSFLKRFYPLSHDRAL
jgi:hypothetical protein